VNLVVSLKINQSIKHPLNLLATGQLAGQGADRSGIFFSVSIAPLGLDGSLTPFQVSTGPLALPAEEPTASSEGNAVDTSSAPLTLRQFGSGDASSGDAVITGTAASALEAAANTATQRPPPSLLDFVVASVKAKEANTDNTLSPVALAPTVQRAPGGTTVEVTWPCSIDVVGGGSSAGDNNDASGGSASALANTGPLVLGYAIARQTCMGPLNKGFGDDEGNFPANDRCIDPTSFLPATPQTNDKGGKKKGKGRKPFWSDVIVVPANSVRNEMNTLSTATSSAPQQQRQLRLLHSLRSRRRKRQDGCRLFRSHLRVAAMGSLLLLHAFLLPAVWT
jgi:hypothetical protein